MGYGAILLVRFTDLYSFDNSLLTRFEGGTDEKMFVRASQRASVSSADLWSVVQTSFDFHSRRR